MNNTEESLKDIEAGIRKTEAEIFNIEDRIMCCKSYAKITPVRDSANYFTKQANGLKKPLSDLKRQLSIFKMGYDIEINKLVNA